jgi:hypothetical protein
VVSLILSLVFKTVFGIFLAPGTCSLSDICKIKNVLKLPVPFSRKTLISSFENTPFCKKNCPINSKKVMKNFSHERLPCKFQNFMVLGHSSKKSQNYGNLYT